MKTPIVNFAKKYNKQNPIRLHVPGHKGDCLLGVENLDLTELDGADNLYLADGIIGKSEKNATALFNFYTYYSAEGSSLSIRAMLYLIKMYGIKTNVKPLVLATRNTHKSFLSAVALLDIEIQWLYNKCNSYLASNITAEELETYLQNCQTKPLAFYVTSPDYLGNIIDIKRISEVCHKYNVFLMVDNAHGSYLKFLQNSIHPIDLGADICCDSAHKTLPALTGAGYLHFSKSIPNFFLENVKQAMSIFGSTSPSYLIMQSLDLLNKKINDKYKRQLNSTCSLIKQLKLKLTSLGYTLVGNEPLKLTINANNFGYTGNYLARILKQNNTYLLPKRALSEEDIRQLRERFYNSLGDKFESRFLKRK